MLKNFNIVFTLLQIVLKFCFNFVVLYYCETQMTVIGHSYDEALEKFLSSAPRYRLAVLKVDASKHEKNTLNLGRELAEEVKPLKRTNELAFQFAVQEIVFSLIKKHTIADAKLGNVVILENPGIMFEPELHINMTEVLRKVSRNTLTILLWPGEVDGNRLSFLKSSSAYNVKQSETNYIIL